MEIDVHGHGDEEFIRGIARERGIHNAEILVSRRTDRENIVDFFSGNVLYTKTLTVMNKVDDGEIKPWNFDLVDLCTTNIERSLFKNYFMKI